MLTVPAVLELVRGRCSRRYRRTGLLCGRPAGAARRRGLGEALADVGTCTHGTCSGTGTGTVTGKLRKPPRWRCGRRFSRDPRAKAPSTARGRRESTPATPPTRGSGARRRNKDEPRPASGAPGDGRGRSAIPLSLARRSGSGADDARSRNAMAIASAARSSCGRARVSSAWWAQHHGERLLPDPSARSASPLRASRARPRSRPPSATYRSTATRRQPSSTSIPRLAARARRPPRDSFEARAG